MKLCVIGGSVIKRELWSIAAQSPHDIDIVIVPCEGREETVRSAVDAAGDVDYILLACGRDAVIGIEAAGAPLVVPRVHDCACLLLSDAARYRDIFDEYNGEVRWVFDPDCEPAQSFGAACTVVSHLNTGIKLLRERYRDLHEYPADLTMLKNLLNGVWDDEFLVVPRGFEIAYSPTSELMCAEPASV